MFCFVGLEPRRYCDVCLKLNIIKTLYEDGDIEQRNLSKLLDRPLVVDCCWSPSRSKFRPWTILSDSVKKLSNHNESRTRNIAHQKPVITCPFKREKPSGIYSRVCWVLPSCPCRVRDIKGSISREHVTPLKQYMQPWQSQPGSVNWFSTHTNSLVWFSALFLSTQTPQRQQLIKSTE